MDETGVHVVDRRKGGFHHCLNRISGYPWEFPFRNPLAVADFISRLRNCVLRTCIMAGPFYRALLLHRGLEPGRENQASIPEEVAARELDRQLPPGLYRKRRRFMIDGLMMGSRDRMLRELERLTLEGVYRRRRNVKEHLGGLFCTIREQRSNYTR